jgi:uncharacterized membrane protein YsdA (DUF1294 family)
VNGQRRVAEKTLLLLALVGGWPGAWLGQSLFNHKKLKSKYQTKLQIVAAANAALLIYVAAQAAA